MQADEVKILLQELQWVRKLLTLQALSSGYKQTDLAAALGVSEATVSRMLPRGFAKNLRPREPNSARSVK
jgi:DNA-binding transcriptional regulator LsrR (DeoR family)